MDSEFGINQALVEELYLRYRENRHAVEESWRLYFDGLGEEQDEGLEAPATHAGNGNGHANGNGGLALRTNVPVSVPVASLPPPGTADAVLAVASIQGRVYSMVNMYRSRGHLFADLDPLGLTPKPPAELTLETFGLSEADPRHAVPDR